jgi:hypothetical protein
MQSVPGLPLDPGHELIRCLAFDGQMVGLAATLSGPEGALTSLSRATAHSARREIVITLCVARDLGAGPSALANHRAGLAGAVSGLGAAQVARGANGSSPSRVPEPYGMSW